MRLARQCLCKRSLFLTKPDRSYDLGMANHVLFHVATIPAAVHELRRVLRPGGRAVLTTAAGQLSPTGVDPSRRCRTARLSIHRPRDRPVQPRPHRGGAGVFPRIERFIREDAFGFPSADATTRYSASGMIEAIANPPADGSHRAQLLPLVAEAVEEIISREGMFRDPNSAGCFVVTNV